jgi:hypothetical protein
MEGKNVWYELPPEVWADIFTKLNYTNEYGETICDTRTVYSTLLVCNYFTEVMELDFIWGKMCEAFPDFDRLLFMHEHQEIAWRDVYKHRVTGIIKTKEIRVGDQSNPENCILFQIRGNGHVYVSTDWINTRTTGSSSSSILYSPTLPMRSRRRSLTKIIRQGSNQYIMVPITEVSSAITKLYDRDQEERSVLDKVVSILPFTRAGRINREKEETLKRIQSGLFVNISAYSPFVLLLAKNGEVYEFMFLPRGMDNYEGMYVPKEVHFADIKEGEKVIYIKATAVANYAVTNHGRIFAWAMFDDPVMMCKRATPPVEILPLREKGIKKIKQLSRDHTLFYMSEGDPLTVSNDQIFYIVVQDMLN